MTRHETAALLLRLSANSADRAAEALNDFPGEMRDEAYQHAIELRGAARQMRDWAKNVEGVSE
jgi:hypothetical protein